MERSNSIYCFFYAPHADIKLLYFWCFINGHPTFKASLWMHSTGQRFPRLRPWKTLDPTLQIHLKQKSVWAADHLEGCYYGWPHRAEPAGPSGCVVVSPSAMMWQSPGVFFVFFYTNHSGNRAKSDPLAGSLHSVNPLFQAVLRIILLFYLMQLLHALFYVCGSNYKKSDIKNI